MKNCVNCGAQMEDQYQICYNCGAQQPTAYQTPPVQTTPPVQQAPVQQPQMGYAQPPMGFGQMFGGSTWDGGVLETFVAVIVASLMISFTCGIATPWAVCYLWNFIIGHVIVDGRRMRFDGNGADLFGQWIIWLLLTAITCGIYSFWVMPRMFKWVATHTHMC